MVVSMDIDHPDNPESMMEPELLIKHIGNPLDQKIGELLIKLPSGIKISEESLNKLVEQEQGLKLEIKNWELKEMQDISNKEDPDNPKKKQFSNESSRKAELENRKDNHQGWADMEQNHKDLLRGMAQARVEVNYRGNQFKAVRALTDLLGKARV